MKNLLGVLIDKLKEIDEKDIEERNLNERERLLKRIEELKSILGTDVEIDSSPKLSPNKQNISNIRGSEVFIKKYKGKFNPCDICCFHSPNIRRKLMRMRVPLNIKSAKRNEVNIPIFIGC